MNILNGWRATVALPLWRAAVAFKKCGERASTEVAKAQFL